MALQDRPHRHGRNVFFIEGEGLVGQPSASGDGVSARAGVTARSGVALRAAPTFRFSRVGPKGKKLPDATLRKVALAMTRGNNREGKIPAGYTYLGQFVDHDLTFDKTLVDVRRRRSRPPSCCRVARRRSTSTRCTAPVPLDPVSAEFYEADRTRLKIGKTDHERTRHREGRLRPAPCRHRVGRGEAPQAHDPRPAQRREPRRRPAPPGDDPLPQPGRRRSRGRRPGRRALRARPAARGPALPVDAAAPTISRGSATRAVVTDVFTSRSQARRAGRRPLLDADACRSSSRSAPSGSVTRWSARPTPGTPSSRVGPARSSCCSSSPGTSGDLGGNPTLPSNWIADWRRLYRFAQIGRPDLKPPRGEFNLARRIDTRLVDPLSTLPIGSFGGVAADASTIRANLAFRNLVRAGMVKLASGQQMAALLRSQGVPVTTLTKAQLRDGSGGCRPLRPEPGPARRLRDRHPAVVLLPA